jgi:hypothetical protein
MRHSTSPSSCKHIHTHTRDFDAERLCGNALIFLLLILEERLAVLLRQLLVQKCIARHRDIIFQAQNVKIFL